MKDGEFWELLPDGYGGFYFHRSTGNVLGLMMLVPIIFLPLIVLIAVGFFMADSLDKVYTDYGLLICVSFTIVSVLYFLQQFIQKPRNATKLSFLLNYVVAPFFVLYLISGSLYWSTWVDEIAANGSTAKKLFVLLYITGSPAIAMIGGIAITFIITIIARAISFNNKHKVKV